MNLTAQEALALLAAHFGSRAAPLPGGGLALGGTDVGCHATANGTRPVHVAAAPDGGLKVFCFACDDGKAAWAALVQVLREVSGGAGLRRDYGRPLVPAARPPKVRWADADAPAISAAQVADLPVWLAEVEKVPTRCNEGVWRPSLRPEWGGVRRARFGGPGLLPGKPGDAPWPGNVLPWSPLERVERAIANPTLGVRPGAVPALALGGDADCPAGHRLLVLDYDWHPGAGDEAVGTAHRAWVLEILGGAGWALFASSSGRGFHALAQLTADDIRAGRWPQAKRHPATAPGVGLDVFPPGYPGMVTLSLARALPGVDLERLLPQVTLAGVGELLFGGAAI